MSEAEEYALMFVRSWGEAVLRQAERARAMRKKFAVDDRNYERMEDWSPSEADLERNFRTLWAEEHTLVWSAYQLERWRARLHRERGQEAPSQDKVLATVRNALEHLDEAEFEEGGFAVARADRGNSGRSLRELPGGGLPIEVGGVLFGLIAPEEVEARALKIVSTIEDELERDAIEWYMEMKREEEREMRAISRQISSPPELGA
ncbi:hypothetical protein [Streptomyces rubiginosohelvolus]|uniref:hypothetical protein n=1 Tax=Streptomyces rubiginosohelvolus TaxID=67362 RepID=UPI0036A6922B